MPDLVFLSDFKAVSDFAQKLKEKETIFAKHFESEKKLLELEQKAKRQKTKFKCCHVLEKLDEKEIKQFRQLADYLAVFGGSISANKFAASSKRIDFLLQPVGTQRLEFDSAIANTAKANNVAVAVLFSDFLNAQQYDRVSLFRNNFLLAKICKRASLPLLVFSGARRLEEMRSSADLENFLALLQQKKFAEAKL